MAEWGFETWSPESWFITLTTTPHWDLWIQQANAQNDSRQLGHNSGPVVRLTSDLYGKSQKSIHREILYGTLRKHPKSTLCGEYIIYSLGSLGSKLMCVQVPCGSYHVEGGGLTPSPLPFISKLLYCHY